jgi:HTH-type transcriptional regulator/antitoxin HigA
MNVRRDSRDLPETFEGLSGVLALRPITDVAGFEAAQEVADALAVLDRRTRDQEEYLETLSILMEAYERNAAPVRASDPIARLRYLMEGRGMSESDLGRVLGERSLGNAVLSGRRGLSKAHIVALARHFGVSTDVFMAK